MENLIGKKRAEGFEGQLIYRVPRQVTERMVSRPFTRHFIVTCLGFYPPVKEHWVERPAGMEDDLLLFVDAGKGTVWVDGKKHEVQTGEVVLIPQNCPHAYGPEPHESWSLYWFHFRGAMASELLEWISFSKKNPVMRCVAWDAVRRQFRSLFSKMELGYHEHSLLEMSRTLINVISLLHRNPSDTRPEHARDRIEASMELMRETFSAPLGLKDYAEKAGYSVPRFSHWFKHFNGVSPMTFLNEIRIQKACELLDTTSLNVKGIAARTGFEDPYYFSRTFSKCTGMSPSHYRKGHRSLPS